MIAEILGDRETGETYTQASPGRLRHLPVNQSHFGLLVVMRIEHARFLHFEPQIVAFTSALAHAGEHRDAAMFQSDVVDQLLNDYGLAYARATEQTNFPAAQIRFEQIDDLDAGLEHLQFGRLLVKLRRLAMDRPALLGVYRTHLIHRITDD